MWRRHNLSGLCAGPEGGPYERSVAREGKLWGANRLHDFESHTCSRLCPTVLTENLVRDICGTLKDLPEASGQRHRVCSLWSTRSLEVPQFLDLLGNKDVLPTRDTSIDLCNAIKRRVRIDGAARQLRNTRSLCRLIVPAVGRASLYLTRDEDGNCGNKKSTNPRCAATIVR